MKILIVEDDEHKLNDIRDFLAKLDGKHSITIERSVREGVMKVYSEEFDLVVLDMALPTFDQTNKASGGASQLQGGIELLRALKAEGKDLKIIILTQYPDIEIDGQFYEIEECAGLLTSRYKCSVLGAVIYQDGSDEWKNKIRFFLGERHEGPDN